MLTAHAPRSMPRPTTAPDAHGTRPSRLEGWLDRLTRPIMPLALPIVALLFLQWPLRDWIGAGSAQANDLAQTLFALYVAAALRHAGRRGAHLVSRPDLAQAGSRRMRALRSIGAPLGTLPWALFVCWQGAPMVAHSVRGLERFPETANPGYFIVKAALLVLAALLALQALADLWRAVRAAAAEASA